MKTVNIRVVEDLLSPLTGWADIDNLPADLVNIDPGNEIVVKAIIDRYFLPYFKSQSDKYKTVAEDSLSYFLSKHDTNFDKVFYGVLLPFVAPADTRLFFVWLWQILFENKNYQVVDLSEYKEINNLNELLHLKRK